jgi:endonuclease-3
VTIPFPKRKVTRAVAEAELAILERTYPHAVTALEYGNPFELLIAVILSAQCTDARVNLTTPFLFARYPDPAALAAAKQEDVEGIIKSANVVMSVVFKAAAFAVDTHVFRVSHRLGLTLGTTPRAVETDVTKLVPPAKWRYAHHWLILHGRAICKAPTPLCPQCPVSMCPSRPLVARAFAAKLKTASGRARPSAPAAATRRRRKSSSTARTR